MYCPKNIWDDKLVLDWPYGHFIVPKYHVNKSPSIIFIYWGEPDDFSKEAVIGFKRYYLRAPFQEIQGDVQLK